jgi:hypothetical protein
MKLNDRDNFIIFSGIVLFVLYLLSGEFFLFLMALASIPAFFLEKRNNLSKQQKLQLGLVLGGIPLIIYGIYVNDFWVISLITVGAIVFVWLILKLIKAL